MQTAVCSGEEEEEEGGLSKVGTWIAWVVFRHRNGGSAQGAEWLYSRGQATATSQQHCFQGKTPIWNIGFCFPMWGSWDCRVLSKETRAS